MFNVTVTPQPFISITLNINYAVALQHWTLKGDEVKWGDSHTLNLDHDMVENAYPSSNHGQETPCVSTNYVMIFIVMQSFDKRGLDEE